MSGQTSLVFKIWQVVEQGNITSPRQFGTLVAIGVATNQRYVCGKPRIHLWPAYGGVSIAIFIVFTKTRFLPTPV